MPEIRFWFEEIEQALIVVHIKSGKKRRIESEKLISQFLQAHRLTLVDCMEIQEREDVTNLFLMNLT